MSSNQTTSASAEIVSANTSGFGLSYAITSILSAFLVILKESSKTVHTELAEITGHHWVTHGLLNIILFLILGFVLARLGNNMRMTANTLITTMVTATVISGLLIAGYFI